MSNPFSAFKNTKCDGCEEYIDEGDDVWLYDGEKLCESCADSEGWICECGSFKKPNFKQCYECSQS